MARLIGREYKTGLLQESLGNDRSELVAIYGRRRVGKTFLIREFFKSELVFEVTGLYNGAMNDQLANFIKDIAKRTNNAIPTPSTWMEAFAALEDYLDGIKKAGKKVVFIDEFPWIATARSKFLMAFENFWNRYL